MNPSIVITLIDPDCSYSLPARWGNDYQIDRIEKVYLNGQLTESYASLQAIPEP